MDGKIGRKTTCGLLIFSGILNTPHGSTSRNEGKIASCNRKISGDFFGDTPYLKAVRGGNVDEVKEFLQNRQLDLNTQNDEGDTDLMLAIKGGEKDEFEENYQEIFDLIVQKINRNWNLQNEKKQTAILLAVGWNRKKCFMVLLQRPEVDPNIPNKDGATPLLAAIAIRQWEMALALINCSYVNVNQRGTDHKLPLQVIFEAKALRLVNIICRRSLVDYDMQVKGIAQAIMGQLVSGTHQRDMALIQGILGDRSVNVANYASCKISDLINAIRRKIEFIFSQLDVNLLAFRFEDRLKKLDNNTQLFDAFLTNQDEKSLRNLCENLQ